MIRNRDQFDVIVAGAGLAGTVAAIASGRSGASTLLVERSGMLGGVATAGMMASITNFFYNTAGQKVGSKIALEIIDRLIAEKVTSPDWESSAVPQIPNQADVMQVVLYRMLKEAGVRLLTHTVLLDAIVEGTELKGVTLFNKAGIINLYAKTVVDCTGDADVAFYAGAPTTALGRDSSTVLFEMGNVDLHETYRYYKEHREDFDEDMDIAIPFEEFERNWLERGIFHTPHNGGSKNALLQKAILEGKYAKEKGMGIGLDALGLFGTRGTRRVLVNSNYYLVKGVEDAEQLSMAEMEGRERCLELSKVLVEIMPGFEQAFLTRMASEIGVRLTRFIEGEYLLTEEELLSAKEFEDAVCFTASIEKSASGVRVTDRVFGIPYRVLLPKKIENLIIGSGKSISAEDGARAKALRGQANTMLIGETAGTAAALAALSGTPVRELTIQRVREAMS